MSRLVKQTVHQGMKRSQVLALEEELPATTDCCDVYFEHYQDFLNPYVGPFVLLMCLDWRWSKCNSFHDNQHYNSQVLWDSCLVLVNPYNRMVVVLVHDPDLHHLHPVDHHCNILDAH